MEITVERLDLRHALDMIIAAVPRRPNIPLLGHISFLGMVGHGLWLSATDLRVYANINCRADIDTAGTCAVPADKLSGIVNGIDSEVISMTLTDDMTMEIVGGSRRYTVSCLSANDFPVFPLVPKNGLQLERGILPDLLTSVWHAASQDEKKPHLCGVHVLSENSRFTAAATDGHRLAIASRDIPDLGEDITPVTIPMAACKLVSGVNAAIDYKGDDVGNAIHMNGAGLEMAFRLLEGDFPAFRRVIPGNLESAFTVSARELAGAIEACGVMIEGLSKAVNLTMADDTLTVSALSPVGIATATVPAMGDPGLEVTVNSRYLLQSIKSMGGEIFVKYKDAVSPLMLIPVDHGPWDERIEILMPLRKESMLAPDPAPVVNKKDPSYDRFIQQGFSRDEAKLLHAGLSLVRYNREAKTIDLISSGEDSEKGVVAWLKHESSPFATYSAAERELKSILSEKGTIEVTLEGQVTGHKESELEAAGFGLYRVEGIVPGHGTPRIKIWPNWCTWNKYNSPSECKAAWDELMKDEKALQG